MGDLVRAGLIVGSLRRESWSRKVARELRHLSPATLVMKEIPIGALPLYNEDLEATPPVEWTSFRSAVRQCEAIVVVTPEYNRSMPGCVKNALDIGSRPYKDNCWSGKPAAIVGLSTGPLGGVAAVHNLRQAFVTVNVATMPHPEIYLGGAGALFDTDGALASSTGDLLARFLSSFTDWAIKNGERQPDPCGPAG